MIREKFALQSPLLHTVLPSHDVDFLAPGSRAQPVGGLHHDGVLGVLLEVGEGEGEAVLGGGAEWRRVETVALLLKGQICESCMSSSNLIIKLTLVLTYILLLNYFFMASS